MEDACQFTEKLTEHKYRDSYEQIAKADLKYNSNSLIDVVHFLRTGKSILINGNYMHLKNFSIAKETGSYELAPANDILAVQLFNA